MNLYTQTSVKKFPACPELTLIMTKLTLIMTSHPVSQS